MNKALIAQYIMKYAFFLSIFFIIEYYLSVTFAANILVAGVIVLLKVVTPIALFLIMRGLRNQIYEGAISGFEAWLRGVQVMLFAALPEAAFIFIYNKFLYPGALAHNQQLMIEQLNKVYEIAGERILSADTIEAYQNMSVPTAIDAAISMVSSDMFIGMFLMLIIAPIIKRKTIAPMNNQNNGIL